MAGVFGDIVNSRSDFFVALASARADTAQALARFPDDPTLHSVAAQLDAVSKWTADGRTPTLAERTGTDMGVRIYREFEMTEDTALHDLRNLIGIVDNYFLFWPDDQVAADPRNRDYLRLADLQ